LAAFYFFAIPSGADFFGAAFFAVCVPFTP
jgi:hypothetical protein